MMSVGRIWARQLKFGGNIRIQGYLTLKIGKADNRKQYITTFSSYQQAYNVLHAIDEEFTLCNKLNGLSEADYITSPVIGADGQPLETPGFAYTPLHAILAPMNYGKVNMQGIDLGLAYLFPEYNLAFDVNFSFYSSTEYYNSLTKFCKPKTLSFSFHLRAAFACFLCCCHASSSSSDRCRLWQPPRGMYHD